MTNTNIVGNMRGKQSAINNETSVRVRRLGHHFSKFKCSLFYWNLRLYINFHTDKVSFSCLEFAVVKTNSDFFRLK